MSQPSSNIPSEAVIQRRKETFARENVNPQNQLSIPRAIFLEMIKNPISPEMCAKLNQACRYPFSKNKIIPIKDMVVQGNKCDITDWTDENDDDYIRVEDVDMRNISCKFWLNGCLQMLNSEFDSNLLLARIYRSDIRQLDIFDSIQLNLYQTLTASGTLESLVVLDEIANPDSSSASVNQILGPLNKLGFLKW